ncbi:UDP-N-acetylglucosamine--N-acetylmuramyl-(pentapeptide) pyrophosphoryl-undecaprenol N-acetylglucosamine transferase [Candidatus Methanobinarius endosymbioticus]|uniref:UDP-N-acetylglucosamine--N-acetylmuramyl-(Pentapeptide) pyrophosphoryl-undecaprenol N-acetylglucosamine transferase n=1 Tax=Candidatus Methanobinarius endosymbioticus TaxID=2006182 RepID=A0A366MBK3_9EURY|nr:UDP-N-acetylglucosamine--N-acetylmuramyl-(pentapeptide) pyrophosphoryl-undecaprenol N-acetylglucosamine transferase [Candidatus Methanobinarius endosymbioticus]
MKALVVITGRGMGGDAVNALNIIRALEKKGVNCEIALDTNAPGLLFKNNDYKWHKVPVPQAGGHAATKSATIKAGFKTIKAAFQTRNLIKKLNVDVVVGIIGGGAVIGCVAAKLARVPAVGIIDTPTDTKVCTRLNTCIVLPEAQLFRSDIIPKNLHKSFFPLTPGLTKGDKDNALKKIKETINESVKGKNNENSKENYEEIIFDENKPSILFSSGSSLFEMMAKGIANATDPKLSDLAERYNILLVGVPLEDSYLDLINHKKFINLGYINWIRDLYELIDFAVLTDDGVMIQEAMACELPAIALTRVKYGRYHNMAGIFPGAVIESELKNLNEKIEETIVNLNEIKSKTKKYSKEVLSAGDNVAEIIIKESKNK